MFTEMLSKEKIEARKMGFDRPSPKFINFLNKYYELKDYVPQNNNFVVFKDYFIDAPPKKINMIYIVITIIIITQKLRKRIFLLKES